MAQLKSLLKTVLIKNAGRKRKCHRNKRHFIEKGDFVLEVKEGQYIKGYCKACAIAMIGKAKKQLTELECDL